MKNIWALVEHYGGVIEEVTFEILTQARELAGKTRGEVSALILGHNVAQLCDIIGQHGTDKIYLVEHPLLEEYTTDGYRIALAELANRLDPDIFLIAATALGRDLAPGLAIKLKTTIVSDCTVLKVNEQGLMEMTRPTSGGRIYSTFISPSAKPQIITIRPGVVGIAPPQNNKQVIIERHHVDLKPEVIGTKALELQRASAEALDISEAETIVAFGRGLEDKRSLVDMEKLAQLLQASLAGSRVAVDKGWIPFERQIGQTGKTVSPKVIICCGISGASQFTMGMQDSKLIIAINTDRRAPIFDVANVPVLGGIHTVVPELIEQLQAIAESETPQSKQADSA